MENKLTPGSQSNAGVVLGALLILAGLLYLVSRFAPFDVGQYGWPLFVIAPGVALIAFGVAVRSAAGLVVPGSIVTVVGLILAVQNMFGLWAAWSYAWALVFPGSVGVGVALLGAAHREQAQIERGLWMALTGLALFAIFGLFFEGVLHVSGVDFGPVAGVVFPVFLIGIGLALLIAAIFSRRRV